MLSLPAGFSVGYGNVLVAKSSSDVAFPRKSSTILVGNNGSGKTTYMKTICGIIPPISSHRVCARSVYMPEELDFPENMRTIDIVEAFFPDTSAPADRLILWEIPHRTPYGMLSKGNRQKLRVLIAEYTAYLGGADVLCLDEPLSGVDEVTAGIFLDGWNGGSSMPPFPGHRIISMHRGRLPDSCQMLVVDNKNIDVLPPAVSCDGWMLYSAKNKGV